MDNLTQLKKDIFSRQTILAEIYLQHGSKSILNYASSWPDPTGLVGSDAAEIIKDIAEAFIGKQEAEKMVFQIQKFPLVSTIDHHGIFGHPFFLNANLLFSLKSNLKFLPVFATSGVSLNNSSWPGCLILTDSDGRQVRLSFFHDGHKTKTVFGAVKIGQVEIERVLELTKQLTFLNSDQKEKLTQIIANVFMSDRVLRQKNFSDQACIISQMLWQEVFPLAPKLVYLPLEDIVSQIIIKDILSNPNHVLHRLFFTEQGWGLTEKYFKGLRGAFGSGRGSYLFWGVDKEGRRVSFIRQESGIKNRLPASSLSHRRWQAGELSMEYQLTPENISQALNERKIYPTSLVCFLVMLHYNFNCLGGFNQTSWLGGIKEKFIELLKEIGEDILSVQISKVATDNFAETPLAFSFGNGLLSKPSLLDLYLNNVNYQALQALAGKMTLAQSLETELPEIYRIVVPEKERIANLLAVTASQIAQNNGLTKVLGLV